MAKSLISEDLRSALLQQWCHERYNASLYLYLAGFFANKGLNNFSNLFLGQHNEEIEHSLLIYEFLVDMNAPIEIGEIDSISLEINNIMDVAETYLDREKVTTFDLDEIKSLTIAEKNGVAEEFLREMVQRQRAELAEANDFYDNAELCSNDWWKVKMWDNMVGE
jgi:ferritin